MGAVIHTTLSLLTVVSALLFSDTRVSRLGLISCPWYCPFFLEILPAQPFPDTRFNSSRTFCFPLVLFECQYILSSLFLQLVKIFESSSCSPRALAAPLSLVLLADAINLLHILLPKLGMKILNNTRPYTSPGSTVLQPSFHFHNKQPTAFQHSFPAGLVPGSISPQLYSRTSLLGMPCERASEALLQPRRITPPASPLSEEL